ncbi:hypothetical protein EDB81DRAFT_759782 [Dactylonectria macrodidyma]|uniref:SWIM-type domain-containing protein n=1 Tax=Dactylonectria macrodidyma TaxID=307937 RepID=A0A9P9EXR4_9HYPO|nr:hypothetical protein EDB81DRAFT_759782 [Dactylonectria macrodidyma]
MESLPSHRQFLTALINSISGIAPPATDPNATLSPAHSSPLQALTQAQRPLLLTLHVLFPNLLLQALDLLDRGLVARLRRRTEKAGGSDAPGGDADTGGVAASGPGSRDEQHSAAAGAGDGDVFVVRSLVTTLTRRSRDAALSAQRYIVHLDVWNCTCAGFTFDAFPSHPSDPSEHDTAPQPLGQWSFGGMSLDGLGESVGHVPCCKHLLACLLVERWPGMLDQYIEDRNPSREEMAGIFAGV